MLHNAKVYFLRPVGKDGPVKIGTSASPRERLSAYAKMSPEPLEIVAELPGGALVEQQFHQRFAASYLHHEWFAASPELTAAIEAIRAGTFDVGSLPPSRGQRLTHRQWAARRARVMGALRQDADQEAARLQGAA